MLTIRLDSNVPLTQQIATGLRGLIAGGRLRPGDELPTVRQLAADLGVNLNTVARAYRLLEDVGLVNSHRGRGTRVQAATELPGGSQRQVRERVTARLREVLAEARLAGLGRPAVEQLLAGLWSEFWGETDDTKG